MKCLKVIVVTGYKPHELGIFNKAHPGITYIKIAVKRKLIELLENGLEWIVISGQLGVELWSAEVAIELKKEYHHLKIAVITPFLDQEERFKEKDKQLYQFVISHADYINSVSNKEYESPNQYRLKNKFIINNSNGMLILYDDEKQGSPMYMYNEAKRKTQKSSFEIITITPFDIQLIIDEEQDNDPTYWT